MSDYTSGDSLPSVPATGETLYEPIDRLGLSTLTLSLDKGSYTGRVNAIVSLIAIDASGVEYEVWSASQGDLSDGDTTFSKDLAAAYESTAGYNHWKNQRVEGVTKLSFKIFVSSSSAVSSNTSFSITTDYHTVRKITSTLVVNGQTITNIQTPEGNFVEESNSML